MNCINYEAYQEYLQEQDLQDYYRDIGAEFIFIKDLPMLVFGDTSIINLNSNDIYIDNDCMVCGRNRKLWREFKTEYKDGREERYIMTYDHLLNTFGKDEADYVFKYGNNSEDW